MLGKWLDSARWVLRGIVFLLCWLGAASAWAEMGSIEAGRAKIGDCIACHDQSGRGLNPESPNLAAQHPRYLAEQLLEFQKGENGKRNNPAMLNFVKNYKEQDIWDLAAYFAAQKPIVGKVNAKLLTLGQKIYRSGIPSKGVPACSACHGPAGQGIFSANFPKLSGQQATYTLKQLQDYRSGERSNGPNKIMNDVANHMNDQEMQAVSSYVEGLH
ncbi:MAG: c-type cytochrome [Gammaproteobacteria bacterium]